MAHNKEILDELGSNLCECNVQEVLKLIDEGVITERDLIEGKLATPKVLDTLKNYECSRRFLPDLMSAMDNSSAECKPGYTDVYFFGTPGAGKTSILMGLASCESLNVSLLTSGGDYTLALQEYAESGFTIPRTPGTFVCTLDAKISSKATPDTVHKINLVEMSGEEFAFEIVYNEDHITSFEKMGTGATELLKNDNRKVFFLIIDPTKNIVRINREKEIGKDFEGKPIKELEYCTVNQQTTLQKMVNLMAAPENRDVMKKVDGIHIIMTKADTLGDAEEREEKALKIFQDEYSSKILNELVNLCKEHNINAQNNFQPKLYTFSLGSFYLGGLFEYDPADSDHLVEAIEETIQSRKNKSWWNRIKRIFNK